MFSQNSSRIVLENKKFEKKDESVKSCLPVPPSLRVKPLEVITTLNEWSNNYQADSMREAKECDEISTNWLMAHHSVHRSNMKCHI